MQEIQETWVRSLAQENPLEKEVATHSIMLKDYPKKFRELEGKAQKSRNIIKGKMY